MFYFCKNGKTAGLLILAISLIFSKRESSKTVNVTKSILKKHKNIQNYQLLVRATLRIWEGKE